MTFTFPPLTKTILFFDLGYNRRVAACFGIDLEELTFFLDTNSPNEFIIMCDRVETNIIEITKSFDYKILYDNYSKYAEYYASLENN